METLVAPQRGRVPLRLLCLPQFLAAVLAFDL